MTREILLGLVITGASISLSGQSSLETTAGGNQSYNAYGMQTAYKWHALSGWSGVGYNDGIKIGAYLKIPFKSNYVGIGDQRLEALLDTDEYDSHGFSVRGASLTRETKDSSLQVFAGLLSQELMMPYMHTSYTSGSVLNNTPLGAVVYQHKLSNSLRMHSLILLGDKRTAIQSLGWHPSTAWRLAGASGVGSGAGYLSGSGDFTKKRIDMRTSYTLAGKEFQRQQQPYYSTELVGLNARLTMTPIDAIRLMFNHERSRTNIVGFPSVAGTFDSANLSVRVKGFQISPKVSRVIIDGRQGSTISKTVSASKLILPRWKTFGAYINMSSPTLKQESIVAVNQFRVSSRLDIRQNYNRIGGQNSFSCGGQWVSNFISLAVDQQVYISPLAQAFGGKSVFQAWSFNIRMRSPHGTHVNLSTVVAPDGRAQWGGYLSGLRYDSVAPPITSSPSFSKYVVHGKVTDENSTGVWGIAIKVGREETVYSDDNGEFFVHVKNTKPLPLVVDTTSSIQSAWWRLQSAPEFITGVSEDASESPVLIVVQMTRASGQTVATN